MRKDQAVTRKEFAQRLGCKQSYVTQLANDGRLVLAEDGKRVLVEASIERMAATKDPAKQPVAARHAIARGAPMAASAADADDGAAEAAGEPPAGDGVISPDFQLARASREHWQALTARRDYEQSIGKLLSRDDVEAAIADAAVTLRGALENLPDILAPQVAAERGEDRCRGLIVSEVEHMLAELSRNFAAASRPNTAKEAS